MSTFLKLCQKTRRDAEIPGDDTPLDTTTQVGELKDLVERVSETWTEVQNAHNDWRWMQHRFEFNTVANQDTYSFGDATDLETSATIDRFSRWILDDWRSPPKQFKTSSGIGTQAWVWFLPWNEFELIYRISTQQPGSPAYITVNPQDQIVIGPEPDDIYTINGNYQIAAQTLAIDGDIPEMPPQFHDLIVYESIQKYAYGESAAEILARGEKYASRLWAQLRSNQLNPARLGSPLA